MSFLDCCRLLMATTASSAQNAPPVLSFNNVKALHVTCLACWNYPSHVQLVDTWRPLLMKGSCSFRSTRPFCAEVRMGCGK